VKSAGDRVATMVTIRVVGLGLGLMALPFAAWPDEESWKWLALTAFIQFGYYALLVRSYGLGDMSVVYPLARGTAPLLTTVGAFIALDERLSIAHFAAIALISIGIMMLSIGSGASRAALGFACATGLSVAGYSLVGGVGVRMAGTVVGFQACLEIVTGSALAGYGLATRREYLFAETRGARAPCRQLVRLWVLGIPCCGAEASLGPDRCSARDQRHLRNTHRRVRAPRSLRPSPHHGVHSCSCRRRSPRPGTLRLNLLRAIPPDDPVDLAVASGSNRVIGFFPG
jgi:multidrug transporter EmrE-like cation transporter